VHKHETNYSFKTISALFCWAFLISMTQFQVVTAFVHSIHHFFKQIQEITEVKYYSITLISSLKPV